MDDTREFERQVSRAHGAIEDCAMSLLKATNAKERIEAVIAAIAATDAHLNLASQSAPFNANPETRHH